MKKQILSGVLLIDKPQGMTSQQVVSRVKFLLKSDQFDSKKAGHTGTLDPMATGLLPICLGEATKFSHYQIHADKSYHAIIKLGTQTDTADAEGQSIATAAIPDFDHVRLKEIERQFLGDQWQIPPMYSALKQDGKKLYEYARLGQAVERQPRKIHIFDLKLTQHSQDKIGLNVSCSKGTYVRTLAEDIAKSLGTLGHLTQLRRTKVGQFCIDNAILLDDFAKLAYPERQDRLLPIEACLQGLPKLVLDTSQGERIFFGQRLNVLNQAGDLISSFTKGSDSNLTNGIEIQLFDTDQRFLGLGLLEKNGRLQPKKLVKL